MVTWVQGYWWAEFLLCSWTFLSLICSPCHLVAHAGLGSPSSQKQDLKSLCLWETKKVVQKWVWSLETVLGNLFHSFPACSRVLLSAVYFLLINLFIMLCTHSSFNFWLAQLLLRRLSNFYCELLLLWERLELICVYTLCKPMPPWQHTTNLSFFFFFNQCHHAEVSCTLGHGLCCSLYKNLRNILGAQEDKGNPTNSDSSLYVQRWHKWVGCL